MNIQENEIPWPEEGDSLFNGQEDWKFNAFLGEHKTFLYEDGYMKGAEVLLASVIESKSRLERDSVIYPALFLFHHNIELRLKRIIEISNRIFNLDLRLPKRGTHQLEVLWPLAKKAIILANNGKDDTPVVVVERVINEMTNISKSSDGFRYPFSLDGEALIKHKGLINLKALLKIIRNVNSFFNGVTAQMDYLDDLHSEIMND